MASKTLNWNALVNAVDPDGQAENPVSYEFSRGNTKRSKLRTGGDGIYDNDDFRAAELDKLATAEGGE